MNKKANQKETPEDKPVSASILKDYAKALRGLNISIKDIETEIPALKDLHDELGKRIPDPRVPERVRHTVADVVLIVLLGLLANCNEWSEIETFAKEHKGWLKGFLTLRTGIPSDTTVQRVFSTVDIQMAYDIALSYFLKYIQMATFNAKAQKAAEEENQRDSADPVDAIGNLECTSSDAESKSNVNKDIIAVDGKVTKSSRREDTDQKQGEAPLNTLNAYSVGLGTSLGQIFIPEKKNEITAMPILLEGINIKDAIITCDALNTQAETTQRIIAGGADYVMAIKMNKPTLYGDFQVLFEDTVLDAVRVKHDENQQYLMTQGREQGTTVKREYFLFTEFEGLYKSDEWCGLKAIGAVRRTVTRIDRKTKEEVTTFEDRYYLSSIDSITQFARAVRGHWGIENSLHWQLDYTFKDDSNKTTRGNGAEGLQLMKKLALMLLKAFQAVSPPYTSLKKIRFTLSHNFEDRIAGLFSIFNPSAI